jgi:GTPase involved in cell partitioning and DNA repair
MKNLIQCLFIMAIMVSCTPKENNDNVRAELMKFHDQLMMDNETIIGNQMKLDTLLRDMKGLKSKNPGIDTVKEKELINKMLVRLTSVENQMNDWMHNFNADFKDPSPEATLQYFKTEREKIAAIAKAYQQEINSSNVYLEQKK